MHDCTFAGDSASGRHRAGGDWRADRAGLFDFAKEGGAIVLLEGGSGAKLYRDALEALRSCGRHAFNAIGRGIKAATGTEMNVFSESFEDVQPKAIGRGEHRLGPRSGLGSAYAAAAISDQSS